MNAIKKINAKSALIGAFIGAVVVVGIAATTEKTAVVGRYQIGTSASTAGQHFAYVIDTVTGQVWDDSNSGFFKPKLSAQ